MKTLAMIFLCCVSTCVTAASNDEQFAQLVTNHINVLSQGKHDDPEFISGLRTLANENHRESQFFLGTQVFTGAIDGEEGIKWLHRAEGNGCAGAAGAIGQMYFGGMHVPKNEAMGLQWLRSAAERGELMSQVFLASLYASGAYGIPKDLARAYSWMYQASKAGTDKPEIALLTGSLMNWEKNLSPDQVREARKMADARAEKIGGVPRYFCAQMIPLR
jgi:TPR repeat protein